MVFTTHIFVFYFLPVFLLVYFNLPFRWRNLWITGASYIHETADENGISQHIHYNERVTRAEWSSTDARWTVTAASTWTCSFLYNCAGYYDYAAGYTPDFPGRDTFTGTIVHPQHWPADLDYTGKRVVVIGSGATAVTLVPELAKRAAHVTMLQRS